VNAPVGGCAVDHLVVAARTLEEGVAWCEATLGITPAGGGQHPQMGTHNRVFAIGSEAFPNAYFEIIAIDPAAPPPGRARWFALDETDLAAGPRLVHWVARSTQLDMHRWGLITVGHAPGNPLAASRETPQGTLSWQILVRDDGRLECRGALPTLIQWLGRHPAEALPPSGVTLKSLALTGVPERSATVLRLRGVAVSSAAGTPITAVLQTPKGEVTLEST
jgi:Glyoxalase-like domain